MRAVPPLLALGLWPGPSILLMLIPAAIDLVLNPQHIQEPSGHEIDQVFYPLWAKVKARR